VRRAEEGIDAMTSEPIESSTIEISATETRTTDPTVDATGLQRLVEAAQHVSPGATPALADVAGEILGARTARLHVVDYSLRRLQQLDVNGSVGAPQPIAGTLAGRAFTSGEVLVSESSPAVVWVPLVDRADRIGLLELDFDEWDGEPALLGPVVAVLVMALISANRYSDLWPRARRSEPLTAAAEVQWDLLPPLSCSTSEVGVAGILEPAYEIGGDSFDYAINGRCLDFAIVDAIGHGMSSVLMSAAAVNSLRNARRAGVGLAAAYHQADRVIATQFGRSYYVTAQFGSLDLETGTLTWINAGHVPPMSVRNDTYAGELACAPSLPLGLGGRVVQVAAAPLQRDDRVLFYTDGITESKSPDGTYFGDERLNDFLVRATLDRVPVAETVRRLSEHVVDYVGAGLKDDATLLLVEYRGRDDAS
jgi:serine phosphatase RsbU (regulator of sigma subunit)